ncbi:class I SAM-dependent methyltransferase [Shimia sp.]|uniref:class I SAM-dependent methyltransferase n=1 Tax=Shimia sp. TaxID=1954381 RepID=UPI0032981F43
MNKEVWGMGMIGSLKERFRQWKLNRRSPADVFTRYYTSNKWGDSDSRSGKGSNLATTEIVRAALPKLVNELQAESFLDLPCGDYFWMRNVDLGVKSYTGGDIVAPMIAANQQEFGRDTVKFEVIDLIQGPVPAHDIVFVRDCLVHLSNAHIAAAVRNIKASGSQWLVTTTNPDTAENVDIATGQWRALNLRAAPFSFPEPKRMIDESQPGLKGSRHDKFLGVWRIADLPDLSALENVPE